MKVYQKVENLSVHVYTNDFKVIYENIMYEIKQNICLFSSFENMKKSLRIYNSEELLGIVIHIHSFTEECIKKVREILKEVNSRKVRTQVVICTTTLDIDIHLSFSSFKYIRFFINCYSVCNDNIVKKNLAQLLISENLLYKYRECEVFDSAVFEQNTFSSIKESISERILEDSKSIDLQIIKIPNSFLDIPIEVRKSVENLRYYFLYKRKNSNFKIPETVKEDLEIIGNTYSHLEKALIERSLSHECN